MRADPLTFSIPRERAVVCMNDTCGAVFYLRLERCPRCLASCAVPLSSLISRAPASPAVINAAWEKRKRKTS